ncbi:MAG TPA: hypothetical protein VGQ52_02065 [Gemmatimonadaceae bacterium]|jgi:hypothetical protein|nr:hypothetical protein [Gemmatimonadaceae bacterium]
MQRAVARNSLLLLLLTGSGHLAWQPAQVWQADLQVRILEVTKSKTSINARVVIYTENDDEARQARLLFLLPLGVGIERLGIGCAATPGPSNVPALRGAVVCDLGAIPDHGYREVAITTTIPTDGVPKRFAVFVYSATPDPVPANNYAERIVP